MPRGVPAEGHVVLIVGAVADVDVHVEVRPPAIESGHHRAHLIRVELGVVAIQIEILSGGPPADDLRSALIDAAILRRAFVTVDIENRNEEEIRFVEKRAPASDSQLAQKHETCIFAVDLAGVDARLHEKRRSAAALQRFGSEEAIARKHYHPDVAS